MNANSQIFNSDTERLSSITIDVESQRETKEETKEEKKSDLIIPLRGILKYNVQNAVDDKIIEGKIINLCYILIIIISMSPIIICDLYFGFTDSTCSSEHPKDLDINLRLYLIVSGLISLSAMIIILLGLSFFNKEENIDKFIYILSCGTIGLLCIIIFNIIWNILGAYIFWGYIYEHGNCNKTFLTYVFVSLIIKLSSSLFGLSINKNKY